VNEEDESTEDENLLENRRIGKDLGSRNKKIDKKEYREAPYSSSSSAAISPPRMDWKGSKDKITTENREHGLFSSEITSSPQSSVSVLSEEDFGDTQYMGDAYGVENIDTSKVNFSNEQGDLISPVINLNKTLKEYNAQGKIRTESSAGMLIGGRKYQSETTSGGRRPGSTGWASGSSSEDSFSISIKDSKQYFSKGAKRRISENEEEKMESYRKPVSKISPGDTQRSVKKRRFASLNEGDERVRKAFESSFSSGGWQQKKQKLDELEYEEFEVIL
jgi:hypothetical protein